MHRADSIYDDRPEERYQFPKQYLGRAQSCVGDWIIYYEPNKATDSRGYFAAAKVQQIIADPSTPDMYLALIEPGTYQPFINTVNLNGPEGYVEQGLLNAERRLSGRAQSAIRPLSYADFNRIIALGLPDEEITLPRIGSALPVAGFADQQSPFGTFAAPRDRVSLLTSRLLRDRAFRQIVLRAYASRCAVTGLKLINGGGRAEVEAAHIQPVENNGPDIINNGIALSGTAHWMFDRGLISFADNLQIIVSSHVNDRDSIDAIINRTGCILPARRNIDRPHPRFLRWHRDNCFKI